MGDEFVTEALSDADACFAAGEIDAAIDVMFDALDEIGPASEQADRIYVALGGLCCTFHASGKFDEGKTVAARIVGEVLSRIGRPLDPQYLGTYVTACIETGSSPFPIRRILRHANLIQVFRMVDAVHGDVAECGCARGLSFMELCLDHAVRHPAATGVGFHVFDSFEGLSAPGKYDLEGADGIVSHEDMAAGRFAFPLELVSRNIGRRFPEVEFHPGWIPASFAGVPERTYRFVHIDVDLHQPTFDSLNYFYPRLSPGGLVITDDFNWPGARKAFTDFAATTGAILHRTDTDQAYVVKG